MLSIQSVWDDTLAFMKREQHLLAPLGLATIGLGNLVATLCQNVLKNQGQTAFGTVLSLVAVAALLWILIGQLAITTLALRGQCSVREALAHGTNRLGRVLVIEMMVGLAIGLVLLPALVPLAPQIHGTDFSHVRPNAAELLWMLFALVFAVFVSVRIALIRPLLIERDMGAIRALKAAFAMTRGHFWQLFGAMAVLVGLMLIIQMATHFVFGALFAIIGKLIESPFTATVLEALVQSFISSVFGMITAVFVAMFYKRAVAR